MSLAPSIKKILVVDDDLTQLKLLEKSLTQNGFQVQTAQEAADGLQFAMDHKPDLIILDVMMPIINGYNFCNLLKDEDETKHIPIIMVTSRDKQEDMDIGKEMGADDYLTKPVNIPILLTKVNELLKKSTR